MKIENKFENLGEENIEIINGKYFLGQVGGNVLMHPGQGQNQAMSLTMETMDVSMTMARINLLKEKISRGEDIQPEDVKGLKLEDVRREVFPMIEGNKDLVMWIMNNM